MSAVVPVQVHQADNGPTLVRAHLAAVFASDAAAVIAVVTTIAGQWHVAIASGVITGGCYAARRAIRRRYERGPRR